MYPHQDLTHKIISAAIEVHKNLGPGLLETVYSYCLAQELELRRLRFHKELGVPLLKAVVTFFYCVLFLSF